MCSLMGSSFVRLCVDDKSIGGQFVATLRREARNLECLAWIGLNAGVWWLGVTVLCGWRGWRVACIQGFAEAGNVRQPSACHAACS